MDKHAKLATIKQWISDAEHGDVDWNLFPVYQKWLQQELESVVESSYMMAVDCALKGILQLHLPLDVISQCAANKIAKAKEGVEKR